MPADVNLSCVTGRLQPVHYQHLELFEQALATSEHLIVAVTNPDSGALFESGASTHRHRPVDNPFTYYERVRLLQSALAERGLSDRTTIVPFDLGTPQRWAEYVPLTAHQFVRVYSEWEATKADLLRAAGYQVTVLEGTSAGRISGTDIRAGLAAGSGWGSMVPPAVREELRDHRLNRAATTQRKDPR